MTNEQVLKAIADLLGSDTPENNRKLLELRRRIEEMDKKQSVSAKTEDPNAGYTQGVEDGKRDTEYALERYAQGVEDGKRGKQSKL